MFSGQRSSSLFFYHFHLFLCSNFLPLKSSRHSKTKFFFTFKLLHYCVLLNYFLSMYFCSCVLKLKRLKHNLNLSMKYVYIFVSFIYICSCVLKIKLLCQILFFHILSTLCFKVQSYCAFYVLKFLTSKKHLRVMCRCRNTRLRVLTWLQ